MKEHWTDSTGEHVRNYKDGRFTSGKSITSDGTEHSAKVSKDGSKFEVSIQDSKHQSQAGSNDDGAAAGAIGIAALALPLLASPVTWLIAGGLLAVGAIVALTDSDKKK